MYAFLRQNLPLGFALLTPRASFPETKNMAGFIARGKKKKKACSYLLYFIADFSIKFAPILPKSHLSKEKEDNYTYLHPRNRKWSHSHVNTNIMRAIGRLKMNHVPKLMTLASGYRLQQKVL